MLITCQYVLSTGGICLWQSKTFCNSSFTVRHHHHHRIWNSCSSFLEIGFHSVRGEWVGALKNSLCALQQHHEENLHTNNANNTKSVPAAISAELETPLLIQARRHSINQATSPKVMLSCQSATPIKESHAQEVMCKDTKCKNIRTNPNGYQFKWIWMLQRWWRYGLWTQQCGS